MCKDESTHAHACGVNEFFGVMIDLPAAAPAIFVNVKRAARNSGNGWRRRVDFVLYRLTMIGELEFWVIYAVELPNHPEEIRLSAK